MQTSVQTSIRSKPCAPDRADDGAGYEFSALRSLSSQHRSQPSPFELFPACIEPGVLASFEAAAFDPRISESRSAKQPADRTREKRLPWDDACCNSRLWLDEFDQR